MGTFAKRIYLFINIIKLIAYFLIYQFIFVFGGQFAGYMLYRSSIEAITYEQFTQHATPQITQYFAGGTAVGMLLSSVAMIAHLLIFKYARISKNIFSEVKLNTLVLSTFLIGCMMTTFNIVAVWLGLENNMQNEIELMMKSGAGVISMAIAAPILEELLFRGAIQGALMRYFNHPWVGITVAALLFGIIHGNPIQIFYATCLGIGFGWIYYRTGSLLPAIVGHIINNSLAVAGTILYGADSTQEMVNSTEADIAIVVVSGALALLFAHLINKQLPRVPKPWHQAGEIL